LAWAVWTLKTINLYLIEKMAQWESGFQTLKVLVGFEVALKALGVVSVCEAWDKDP
jgi:hypothetical protein